MVQAEEDQIVGLSDQENDDNVEIGDYDDNESESILSQINGTNELQNESNFHVKNEPIFNADSNKKLR